jgi:O-antigen biosynthesis protein
LGALAGLPNVHRLGPRPHAALPAYLAAADACLIPFARSPFTDAVNPVKVYEYLATGGPIVATPLPELAPFAPVCYQGEGADGWLRALDAALAEAASDPRREERRRLARANTWDDRAAAFGALLTGLGEGAGGRA